MTVAVASYQRREPLRRLLGSLAAQLRAEPRLGTGLEVVVVLDGSEDGSREMLAGLAYPAPLRTLWQPNRGLASARNAGVGTARSELVWFLDDDLLLGPGLLARHRRLDGRHRDAIILGPCAVRSAADGLAFSRRWWEEHYAGLAAAGTVTRFEQFSVANASGPVRAFTEVGGFDERFVGYGMEDHEIGLRLLRAGVEVRFDAQAVALHEQERSLAQMRADRRGEGRNAVRLAALHPEALATLFPEGPRSRAQRALAAVGARRPRTLRGVSAVAGAVATAQMRLRLPGVDTMVGLSRAAAHAAGVAEGDPALLRRLLGLPAVGPSAAGSPRPPP